MSAHRNTSPSIKLPQDLNVSKGLAASRWAPGAIDDQMMDDQQMTGVSMSTSEASTPMTNSLTNSRWALDSLNDKDQQMTGVKLPIDEAPNWKTNGLVNSRWASEAAVAHPAGNNKATKFQQKRHPNSILNQTRSRASRGCRATLTTDNPTTTTHRIIGPLSEEEKTVKMEKPLLQPGEAQGSFELSLGGLVRPRISAIP